MKRVVLLFISLVLISHTAFDQINSRFFSLKGDSLMNQEILNYSKLKEEISFSTGNFKLDKVLILNNRTQVIQMYFGITGYSVRFLFYPGDSSMFLISFGRSDYLEYFKKGYKKLLKVCYNNNSGENTLMNLIDALLPMCYKIYKRDKNDSLISYKRDFNLGDKPENKPFNISIVKGNIFVHNTIFIDEVNEVISKRDEIFMRNIMPGTHLRKRLIYYRFKKVDVIPVTINKTGN